MKKTTKLFNNYMYLILLIICSSYSQLKAQENRFLVAKYVTNPTSSLIIDLLKEQIQDEEEYQSIINELNNHSYFFTLIYDTENNTSLYQLDSVSSVKNVNAGGNYEFVIRDKDNVLYAKENFVGSEYYLKGKLEELSWEITKEEKKIGEYNCVKAISKDLNHCSVWFTKDIPIISGPEIFSGLPGFILYLENALDQTSLQSLKFTDNVGNFMVNFENLKTETENNKKLTLKRVIESKNHTVMSMLR